MHYSIAQRSKNCNKGGDKWNYFSILHKQNKNVRSTRRELPIKVSKFQKQIFLFSFEPKMEQDYFFYFCPKDLKWAK